MSGPPRLRILSAASIPVKRRRTLLVKKDVFSRAFEIVSR
jgi:hypothetical protein